jgi:hypothetical protein
MQKRNLWPSTVVLCTMLISITCYVKGCQLLLAHAYKRGICNMQSSRAAGTILILCIYVYIYCCQQLLVQLQNAYKRGSSMQAGAAEANHDTTSAEQCSSIQLTD